MTSHRPFEELPAAMTPERRARNAEATNLVLGKNGDSASEAKLIASICANIDGVDGALNPTLTEQEIGTHSEVAPAVDAEHINGLRSTRALEELKELRRSIWLDGLPWKSLRDQGRR